MAETPPPDLVPINKPADTSGGPPADLVPITPVAKAPQPTAVGAALKPVKDIPKDIIHDVKSGVGEVGKAMDRAKSGFPGNLLAGPQALLGASQVAAAPVTGAAKALVGDPARNVIPQDNAFGKVAANTLEDAAAMFGPSMVNQLSHTIAKASGPVRTLMENGVQLTLGQLEPKIAKRMEEAAKSVPVLGSFIRAAEGRSVDTFNVATVNKALSPIGAKVDAKNGREALVEGEKAINEAYDKVRSNIPALLRDSEFNNDIQGILRTTNEMPPGHADRLKAILMNRVEHRFGQVGGMDGTALKKVESELTTLANESKSSADAAERSLGYKIDEVKEAMRDALQRQYPAIAADLKEVNRAFSRLADVQRAASSSAVSAGRFTPGQLLQAIRRSDKSPRNKKFIEGDKPLQEWAEAAHGVIGNKLPDSGTTERALWDVGGGMAAYLHNPAILGGILGGSAPYTEVGQKGLNAAVLQFPDVVQTLKRLSGQAGGPVAGVAAASEQNNK